MTSEIKDFITSGAKLNRFRENRSLPLTGFFKKNKYANVDDMLARKCKLTVDSEFQKIGILKIHGPPSHIVRK